MPSVGLATCLPARELGSQCMRRAQWSSSVDRCGRIQCTAPLAPHPSRHHAYPRTAGWMYLRAVRGGGEDVEDSQAGNLMGQRVRVKEEAALNPRCRPFRNCDEDHRDLVAGGHNLARQPKLIHRGGLREILAAAWLALAAAMRVSKWASLLVFGTWGSARARRAIKRRVKPAVITAKLDYPPLSIASVGDGALITAGGGGLSAPGRPNRVTIFERDGAGLVLKCQETFTRRVEAVQIDTDQRIFVHTGTGVAELAPGILRGNRKGRV